MMVSNSADKVVLLPFVEVVLGIHKRDKQEVVQMLVDNRMQVVAEDQEDNKVVAVDIVVAPTVCYHSSGYMAVLRLCHRSQLGHFPPFVFDDFV